MATSSEFKLVNIQSKKYASYLSDDLKLSETQSKRIGFYYLVIESVSQIKDINEISDTIIDKEFCKVVLGENNDDAGVDAVVINEDNKTISLFCFKFREKFKPSTGQSTNDATMSMKFLSHVANEDTTSLTARTKRLADSVIEKLNSEEIWTTKLYVVSNENNSLPVNDSAIEGFKQMHGLDVVSINLNHIVDFMANRPDDTSASIFLKSSSVMSYEEDDLSSAKSYLVEIPLSDIIRMTCTDSTLRNNYNLDKIESLEGVKLDLGLLFDNVRGFLGDTRYNQNILDTLRSEPTKFFMYNNGLTMTAKNIRAEVKNGNKKMLLTLDGFQIVNGGQTLRSIYKFKDSDFDETKLSQASVLVRVFQTQDNSVLTSNIAEFTNSQNAISSIDLKSVTSLQIQIEQLMRENGILYVRKAGDTGTEGIDYEHRISMEKMAQIIYSKQGHPDRATNQKKRLFEKHYSGIFEGSVELELLPDYVVEYFKIHTEYKHSKYSGFEQKYFYMLYLSNNKLDIKTNMELIENALARYRGDEDLSDARKLIQTGFKEKLNELVDEKISQL